MEWMDGKSTSACLYHQFLCCKFRADLHRFKSEADLHILGPEAGSVMGSLRNYRPLNPDIHVVTSSHGIESDNIDSRPKMIKVLHCALQSESLLGLGFDPEVQLHWFHSRSASVSNYLH